MTGEVVGSHMVLGGQGVPHKPAPPASAALPCSMGPSTLGLSCLYPQGLGQHRAPGPAGQPDSAPYTLISVLSHSLYLLLPLLRLHPENWNLRDTPYFLLCPLMLPGLAHSRRRVNTLVNDC